MITFVVVSGLTIDEAVNRGLMDAKTGVVIHPDTGRRMSLQQAIKEGILDADKTEIKMPGSKESVSLSHALKAGIVDSETGDLKDLTPGQSVSVSDPLREGLVVSKSMHDLSVFDAYEKCMFDSESRVFDPNTGRKLTFEQAINCGLLNSENVWVIDPTNDSDVCIGFEEAIERNIIDLENGTIYSRAEKGYILIKEGIDQGLISKPPKEPLSLEEALEQGVLTSTGTLIDPDTNNEITLAEAINKRLIDQHKTLLILPNSTAAYTLEQAINQGLVDPATGIAVTPDGKQTMTLGECVQNKCLVQAKPTGYTLKQAAERNMLNVLTNRVVDPTTKRELTLGEAIDAGIINAEMTLVKDTDCTGLISLIAAIEKGLVDADTAEMVHPITGKRVPLFSALLKGLGLSVQEAVDFGYFNPDSGKFIHPETKAEQSLAEAIDSGLIDTKHTLVVNPVTGQKERLQTAIDEGTVDVITGNVIDPTSGQPVQITDAVSQGLFQQDHGSHSLEEAMNLGLIDSATGLVQDPDTGKTLTVQQAVTEGLIDSTMSLVVDPVTKEEYSLHEALQKGLIDSKGNLINKDTGHSMDVSEALVEGLLTTDLAGVGLSGIINNDLFDRNTGLVTDPMTSRQVPLKEAFKSGLIDTSKTQIVDTQSGKLYTFDEAVEKGLLNPENWSPVRHPIGRNSLH